MSALLAAHGTKLFALKPRSIVDAAAADLKLRRAQRGAHDREDGLQAYCFHRAHVARADSVVDLIERAIRGRYDGVYCGKRITRIIYSDENLLRETYALVRARTDDDEAAA